MALAARLQSEPTVSNGVRHEYALIDASDTAGAGGVTYWITGLPGDGKTTLAHALAVRLAGVDEIGVLGAAIE